MILFLVVSRSDQAFNYTRVHRGLIADEQHACLDIWHVLDQTPNSTANRTADPTVPLFILHSYNTRLVYLALNLFTIAAGYNDNGRATCFARCIDDSTNQAFPAKWNQLFGSAESRRSARR
jgi:hypothetical protein